MAPNKLEFKPDVSKEPASTYNLFTGYNHFEHLEPVNVDLTVILDHINCLCGFQEEMYFEYIAFLAHIVQRPYELTHSTHIFISEQGVGKDTHNEFITNVFSEKYCLLIDSIESVVGIFNSLLGGKLLVSVNEADPNESKERDSKIKHLVTADKVVIEKKHKDAIQSKNYARLMWFSNKKFAFPMELNTRRQRISESSNKYILLPETEKRNILRN